MWSYFSPIFSQGRHKYLRQKQNPTTVDVYMPRRRIALLTFSDPTNRRAWSGTKYYILRALEKHCGEVYPVEPVFSRFDNILDSIGTLADRMTRTLLGKRFDYKRSPFFARRYSNSVAKSLRKLDVDIIFAVAAANLIAYLPEDTTTPIVGTADTTFSLINDYYHGFTGYLQHSYLDGMALADKALRRSTAWVYPTQWAADSAINDHHISAEELHVIPYGANIDDIPTAEQVLDRSRTGSCRMLFIGVDWIRKGGDIAYQTLLHLEQDHGIEGELIICGCQPPAGLKHPRMNVVGFLNKNDEKQRQVLNKLFLDADYLLLPTRSECYGIVFCEASAYGLPSITTDTGGVSGVVSEGRNGFLLPIKASGDQYAKTIAEIEKSPGRYEALVRSTRQEYDERLNWDRWGQEVAQLLESITGSGSDLI